MYIQTSHCLHNTYTLPQTRGYSRPGLHRVQGTTGYRNQWRIPIRHTGTPPLYNHALALNRFTDLIAST